MAVTEYENAEPADAGRSTFERRTFVHRNFTRAILSAGAAASVLLAASMPASSYYFYAPGTPVYAPDYPVNRRLLSKPRKPREAKQPAVPATAVKGPLIIAISIASQRLTVFDDGVPIAHAPVSTGMAGHPTPMGVFSVIQKERFHRSNIYSGAPMPFMQRITWSGVAMHAGVLPGYPASHGCIRMPQEFAVKLYGMTKVGARVVITRNDVTPFEFEHARLAVLKKGDAISRTGALRSTIDEGGRALRLADASPAAGSSVIDAGKGDEPPATPAAADARADASAATAAHNVAADPAANPAPADPVAAETMRSAPTTVPATTVAVPAQVPAPADQAATSVAAPARPEAGNPPAATASAVVPADAEAKPEPSANSEPARSGTAAASGETATPAGTPANGETTATIKPAPLPALPPAREQAAAPAPATTPDAVAAPNAAPAQAEVPAPDSTSASTSAPAPATTPEELSTMAALPIEEVFVPPSRPARSLRSGPVSVFISRKEGKLFIRKGFEPLFSTRVTIARPEEPIGTHVFTASEVKPDGVSLRWMAMSLTSEAARPVDAGAVGRGKSGRTERTGHANMTSHDTAAPAAAPAAAAALDRIDLSPELTEQISALMSVGASLIISDQGLGYETGLETDFIVVTPVERARPSSPRGARVVAPARKSRNGAITLWQ